MPKRLLMFTGLSLLFLLSQAHVAQSAAQSIVTAGVAQAVGSDFISDAGKETRDTIADADRRLHHLLGRVDYLLEHHVDKLDEIALSYLKEIDDRINSFEAKIQRARDVVVGDLNIKIAQITAEVRDFEQFLQAMEQKIVSDVSAIFDDALRVVDAAECAVTGSLFQGTLSVEEIKQNLNLWEILATFFAGKSDDDKVAIGPKEYWQQIVAYYSPRLHGDAPVSAIRDTYIDLAYYANRAACAFPQGSSGRRDFVRYYLDYDRKADLWGRF